MGNFFAELKRRHIYRVAAAYAVVASVVLQISNNVAPGLNLPNWAISLVIVLLSVGFPIALIFAWVLALNAGETPAQAKTGTADWVLAAIAVVFLGMFAYQQLLPSRAIVAAQTGLEAARQAASAPAGISGVVLPFANMSGDASQEFLSDGMTQEITSALAKVPDLRVVGRTSAFQFKGQSQDLRAIGQSLAATHLIEGSVRKDGNRVRITAQLIKADDGLNVWADSYDRELTDIFAIQEDIARAIAASLRMPLGLKPGENLVSNRPKDQQTYELYLRGIAALRARTRQEVELLEQTVARDPNYAPGWAMLSEAHRETALVYERAGEQAKVAPALNGAEAAARKAIALLPGYAGGYGSLAAIIGVRRGRWMEAMDLFKQGFALDPDEPEFLEVYSSLLFHLGYLKQSLEMRERLHLLEPLVPLYNRVRAQAMAANGMTEAGLKEVETLCFGCALFQFPAYAELGRFREVADMADMFLETATPAQLTGNGSRPYMEAIAQVMRAAASKTEPPARLPDIYSEWNFIYAYTKTPERVLDWPEKTLKEGDYRTLQFVWWPAPSAVRKTERFKKLVRDAG